MVRKKYETVNMQAGFGLLQLMSEQLYSRWTAPVVELVKNSLDSGAENIDLYFESGRSTPKIVIEDDGKGMDKQGITGFYKIGTSTKKDQQYIVDRNGRRRPIMGRYGVGNLGLFALGTRHNLETIAEGIIRETNVDFKKLENQGVDWQNYEHNIEINQDARRKNGTIIEIRGLKDKYSSSRFPSLRKALHKAIGRELSGHFRFANVSIDGKRVKSYAEIALKGVKPKKISFKIKDPDTKKSHSASGQIWVCESSLKPEESGIFPLIKSASPIRDGHLYSRVGIMPAGWNRIKDKIYGEINADFLEDKLNLTREDFRIGDAEPIVEQFYKKLNVILKDIFGEHEKNKKAKQSKAEQNYLEHLSTFGRFFRGIGLGSIDQKIDLVEESDTGKTKGIKRRKYRDKDKDVEKPESNGGTSNRDPSQNPTIITGKRVLRLGGRVLNTDYADDVDKPLVFVDDTGKIGELKINRESDFYKIKREGDYIINTELIDVEVMRALSAYRMHLDNVTDHSVIEEFTQDQMKKLGAFKKKKESLENTL
jgi:hypothetical protein